MCDAIFESCHKWGLVKICTMQESFTISYAKNSLIQYAYYAKHYSGMHN